MTAEELYQEYADDLLDMVKSGETTPSNAIFVKAFLNDMLRSGGMEVMAKELTKQEKLLTELEAMQND